MPGPLEQIEAIALRLPEAIRVDVAAWGDRPTYRVRGRNFVFAANDGASFSVKLDAEEAVAVTAGDPDAEPTGHGLGRHGWVTVTLGPRVGARRWREVEEWIHTSYSLIAPASLVEAAGLAG